MPELKNITLIGGGANNTTDLYRFRIYVWFRDGLINRNLFYQLMELALIVRIWLYA